MSIKIAMESFFNNMMEGYRKSEYKYPVSPKVDFIDEIMYIGEPDEEGWCGWRPIKKDVIHDLKDIEEELEIEINYDVKEYFNSYYFIRIEAKFKSYDISLKGVTPSEHNYELFKNSLRDYKYDHDGKLNYIPLGMDTNEDLIVVENTTGEILIEDYERRKYKVIAASLEEFISQLKPVII